MPATITHLRTKYAVLSALAASLLAISGVVQAHYFCVSTAQEFQNALTQSSDGGIYNGEDNDIYMVHGTYQTGGAVTGNDPFFFHSQTSTHYLGIYGSYAEGCSAPTPTTPRTKLDGNDTTGVLTVRNDNGRVAIFGLTLQNGRSGSPGAGLQVNFPDSSSGDVYIQNNIIRNNHGFGTGGGLYAKTGGNTLRVTANLIEGNSVGGDYGAGYVFAQASVQNCMVLNNTVRGNSSEAPSNPVGGLFCGGPNSCKIYNNIFWNNGGIGLYLGAANADVQYNDYGTLGGTNPPSVDIGNVSVNPGFVDAAGGDFHLAGNSPLLAVSPIPTFTTDLDGHTFTTTSARKIDLGAYAETIFIDGFNGN